jgi:hypothetical protein
MVLHDDSEDDVYVWQLITQMLLDMYRHLAPNTVQGYAREYNLMLDFQHAVPGLRRADVMGGFEVDISGIHVTTTHAILWLHLERDAEIAYGTIRKTRSVHTKLCQLYGTESPLNQPGGRGGLNVSRRRFVCGWGVAAYPAPPQGWMSGLICWTYMDGTTRRRTQTGDGERPVTRSVVWCTRS